MTETTDDTATGGPQPTPAPGEGFRVAEKPDDTHEKVGALVQAASYVQGAIQALKLAKDTYLRTGRDDSGLETAMLDLEDEKEGLDDEREQLQQAYNERIAQQNAQAASAEAIAEVEPDEPNPAA